MPGAVTSDQGVAASHALPALFLTESQSPTSVPNPPASAWQTQKQAQLSETLRTCTMATCPSREESATPLLSGADTRPDVWQEDTPPQDRPEKARLRRPQAGATAPNARGVGQRAASSHCGKRAGGREGRVRTTDADTRAKCIRSSQIQTEIRMEGGGRNGCQDKLR